MYCSESDWSKCYFSNLEQLYEKLEKIVKKLPEGTL